MNRIGHFWKVFLILLMILAGWGLAFAKRENVGDSQTGLDLTFEVEGNFARAEAPIEFQFPQDFGAHDDFQTEWWYYTGNLETGTGRRFGYQLTIFRRALLPPEKRFERPSEWAVEQVYLAHFAITDVQNDRFYADEKLARGSAGLAGAFGQPYFQVWLEDWRVVQIDGNRFQLNAKSDRADLVLFLTDLKGVVFQGEHGFSRKGEEIGNASYYISQTRLLTEGKMTIEGQSFDVKGWSWMDHEFSTSALGEDQVGWDWFSLQFDNNHEIMLFTLRKEDGTIDRFSMATLILPDGRTQLFAFDEFTVTRIGEWKSPATGAVYPAGWRINIPAISLDLEVHPLIPNQELVLSYIYWEGAVSLRGQLGGEEVNGYGYVELTGYGQSMRGRF